MVKNSTAAYIPIPMKDHDPKAAARTRSIVPSELRCADVGAYFFPFSILGVFCFLFYIMLFYYFLHLLFFCFFLSPPLLMSTLYMSSVCFDVFQNIFGVPKGGLLVFFSSVGRFDVSFPSLGLNIYLIYFEQIRFLD